MRMFRVVLATALLVITAFVVGVQPAQAAQLPPAPTWGACGVGSSPEKVVKRFGSLVLRCGGPRFSRTPSWGYRHILWRHQKEFKTLAAPARLNWRDLAHWAIHYNVVDPDHVVVDGNSGCRDRILSLHDRNGRLVMKQRFRLIYNSVDGKIITVYPGGAC